jgi:hypothetical protein
MSVGESKSLVMMKRELLSAAKVSPGARTCCVKSVCLLQPPAGVWNETTQSAGGDLT